MSDTALAVRDPQTILSRYSTGEEMAEIAQSYGLTSADQIYRQLIEQCPDEWKAHQAAKALRRLEEATTTLESTNPLEPGAKVHLGLARTRVAAAQWELERLLRRLYGTEQANVGAAIQLNINLGNVGVDVGVSSANQLVNVKHNQDDKP